MNDDEHPNVFGNRRNRQDWSTHIQHLLERGHAVRAMVHKEDDRSEALRSTGVEVVVGELLVHEDVIRAAAGTIAAYFCHPVSPETYSGNSVFRGRGQAGGAQNRRKHVADFRAGRTPKATPRATTGSPNVFSTGLAFRPSTSVRPSSRNGSCSRLCARPLSKMASSICRTATGDMLQSPGRTRRGLSRPSWRSRPLISGKPYPLCGPTELDQAGIAAAMTEVRGRKISYRPLTIPNIGSVSRRHGYMSS